MRRKNGKPEESKTVRQWALLGRIPIEGTPPSYLWTDYDKNGQRYIRVVYYHLDNTREMTEEEQQEFLAAYSRPARSAGTQFPVMPGHNPRSAKHHSSPLP